jgi:hypothetical protein
MEAGFAFQARIDLWQDTETSKSRFFVLFSKNQLGPVVQLV